MKVVLKRRRRVKLPRPQTLGGASNVRLLENGDERETESGDIRILE